jgi:hypothetical protein
MGGLKFHPFINKHHMPKTDGNALAVKIEIIKNITAKPNTAIADFVNGTEQNFDNPILVKISDQIVNGSIALRIFSTDIDVSGDTNRAKLRPVFIFPYSIERTKVTIVEKIPIIFISPTKERTCPYITSPFKMSFVITQ